MSFKLGPLYTKLLPALQTAHTHTVTTTVTWQDRGFSGMKVKRYLLMIRQISEQEAKQQFNYVLSNRYGLQKTVLILAFAGDLPPSIHNRFSQGEHQQGCTEPYTCTSGYVAEGFMHELGRFGVSEETEWDAV